MGSYRPWWLALSVIVAGLGTVTCSDHTNNNLEWAPKNSVTQNIGFTSQCKKIGVYCGAGDSCCTGLVCEPVVSKVTGKIAPRCAVPDPSTMDAKACYADDHICYFHNQCCSGHCEDLDADHIFECTPLGDIPTNNTHAVKPTEKGKDDETQHEDVGDSFEDENESVHWGRVDSTIPLLAIIFGSLTVIGVVVFIGMRTIKRSRDSYQSLGLDEIPSSAWKNNNFGGKYVLGWHDELIDEYKADECTEFPTAENDGPPLPPRDYEIDTFMNGGENPFASAVSGENITIPATHHSNPELPEKDYLN